MYGPIFPRFLQDWTLDAVLENEEVYAGDVDQFRYSIWTQLLDSCKDQHSCVPSFEKRIIFYTKLSDKVNDKNNSCQYVKYMFHADLVITYS
jgi:hypothetical protein